MKANIDTITLSTNLRYYDLDVIKRYFNPGKEGNNRVYYYNERGFKYKYYHYCKGILVNTLHITLSPEKLIGEQLSDTTYKQFENAYNKRIYQLFNFIYPLELQKLNRIDYKIDYYTEHKDIYIKLLQKTTKEYNHLKRKKNYNSSLYLSSKSRNINIYDREQYCIDKHKSIDEIEKYKNIIRYEVQIKKNKIYNNLKNWGLIDCLFNYVNIYDMNYFIDDVLSPIIYKGNYYNQYHSNKIIQEHYTDYITLQLIELQKDISIFGVSNTRNKYSPYQFSKYIKLLQNININPIPIPKGDNIRYLENPINYIFAT